MKLSEEINDSPLILIVDDILDNISFLELMLRKRGFEIMVATDGPTALKIMQAKAPDLVLLDIMMPDMDGYEVCTIMKEDPRLRDLPVIFLSSKNESDDVVKGFKMGASDYVTKPFNIYELIARIKTHISLKRARDKNKSYISQLQKANDELNTAEQNLRQMNASKDRFFSIIAHDLRNPFQGLLGISELLKNNIHDLSKEDIIDSVGDLNQSAEKLYKLLENLLAWSRIQIDSLQLSIAQCNLNEIIRETAANFEIIARNKLITMKVADFAGQEIPLDKNIIKTVLRNLISNAIKFTPIGGKIFICADHEDGKLKIGVKDTGIGIAEEDMTKIFRIDQQFSRQGTNQEEGSGIGLILCRELIEKHGGRLIPESIPGQGSTFWIELPI